VVLLQVSLERRCLLERVQILALQVLDNGQFGHLAVVGLDNQDRHFGPSGFRGRTESALAGNELIAIVELSHHHWLEQSMCLDALGQGLHIGLVEGLTRLVRIAVDA